MDDRLRSLALTSLAHSTNDGSALLYPILITFYINLPGIQLPTLGGMAVVYYLVSGLLSTPIGSFADRTGKYGVLLSIGIAILGFSGILLALPFWFPAYTIPLIIAGAFVLGSGQAFYHPLGASVLRNTFNRGGAPKAMGYNGSFGSLGRAVWPPVIGFLMLYIGEVQGLFVYSFYSFGIAVVLYLGLRGLDIKVKPKPKAEITEESIEKKKAERRSYMPFVYILTAAVFIRALFLTGTSTFMPTYLEQLSHSKNLAFLVIFIAYLLPVFGQPMFGSLTSKRGGKFTVVITFILSTVFFGLMLLFSSSLLFTTVFFGLFAGTAYSGFPVLLGFVGQVVPKDKIGISNSIVWGIGQTIGGAGGAATAALLTAFFSVYHTITIMYLIGIIALLLIPLLPSKAVVDRNNSKTTQQSNT